MNEQNSLVFARNIISRVSRTFAISIKLLPGNLGKAVLIGYLLCRIADTIEDDSATPAARRQDLLSLFLECYKNPTKLEQFVTEIADIQGDEAYRELLRGSKKVFDVLYSLPPKSAQIVWHWASALASGMREFVGRYPHGIHIQTLEEYRLYCYYVAGTVGHMLTELFYYHSPWVYKKDYEILLSKCESFGEALQTINILKDISWDKENENDVFIPEALLQRYHTSQENILSNEYRKQNYEALKNIIAIAKEDLDKALEYFYAIPRLAITVRFFCLLPIIFAVATLREIENTNLMLQTGGVVKISRKEVKALMFDTTISFMSNTLTKRLVAKLQKSH